jgi:hypothetical protein
VSPGCTVMTSMRKGRAAWISSSVRRRNELTVSRALRSLSVLRCSTLVGDVRENGGRAILDTGVADLSGRYHKTTGLFLVIRESGHTQRPSISICTAPARPRASIESSRFFATATCRR